MANATTPVPEEDDVFTFSSTAQREYPLAPIGEHKVKVVRALFSMRDPHPMSKKTDKVPTVSLMLESDQTYAIEDSTGSVDRNYRLFKTMSISDNKKANMFAFFRDVLGIDVPLNDKKQIALQRKVVTMDDGEDKVHLPQFENLECKVVVKHEKGENDGKVRDFVETMYASKEQQAFNAQLFRTPEA